MSFANDARRVRDAGLPLARRVAALRSCVQQYGPLGYHVTLAYLATLVGPWRTDAAALVRAVDVLAASRARAVAAEGEYAERRRQEKRLGRRQPASPRAGRDHYGWWPAGAADPALFLLTHWAQGAPCCRAWTRAWLDDPDPVAAELRAAVAECLAGGGTVGADRRRLIAARHAELVADCRRPGERARAARLLPVADALAAASGAAG